MNLNKIEKDVLLQSLNLAVKTLGLDGLVRLPSGEQINFAEVAVMLNRKLKEDDKPPKENINESE